MTATGNVNHTPKVGCAMAEDGLCDLEDPSEAQCDNCERYSDLLREARALYGSSVWAVTPDGLLQEVTAAR